ncbi:hypothetical protein [Nocardia brasiliensis]|uniref:hypothetical protein n=1 Tax=Nocardia brasiliensis TaxID=37326 RepID=UPI0018951015|nr:hypothetical protein [Nocardia brasiliensis]MBF6128690.1 hypothetical protein [Nocardia brasiliensis]
MLVALVPWKCLRRSVSSVRVVRLSDPMSRRGRQVPSNGPAAADCMSGAESERPAYEPVVREYLLLGLRLGKLIDGFGTRFVSISMWRSRSEIRRAMPTHTRRSPSCYRALAERDDMVRRPPMRLPSGWVARISVLMPGRSANGSLYRLGPEDDSRKSSRFQQPPTTSRARPTPQQLS